MDIHRILTYNRTPTRRLRFSLEAEIPETPRTSIPESQISTQWWDSQNGPTPPRTPADDSDSTQSWDSHNGPRPVHLSPRIHAPSVKIIIMNGTKKPREISVFRLVLRFPGQPLTPLDRPIQIMPYATGRQGLEAL
jgi:hypothetical protein